MTIAVVERGEICFPFLFDGKVRSFESEAEAEVFLLKEGADPGEIRKVFLFVELWEDGTPIVQDGEVVGGGEMSIEAALGKQFAAVWKNCGQKTKKSMRW